MGGHYTIDAPMCGTVAAALTALADDVERLTRENERLRQIGQREWDSIDVEYDPLNPFGTRGL